MSALECFVPSIGDHARDQVHLHPCRVLLESALPGAGSENLTGGKVRWPRGGATRLDL